MVSSAAANTDARSNSSRVKVGEDGTGMSSAEIRRTNRKRLVSTAAAKAEN